MKRYFEFVGTDTSRISGKAEKFWEITLAENEFKVRFGKIGSTGQTTVKTFSDSAETVVAADKLIAEKVRKGYIEVSETKGNGSKLPNQQSSVSTKKQNPWLLNEWVNHDSPSDWEVFISNLNTLKGKYLKFDIRDLRSLLKDYPLEPRIYLPDSPEDMSEIVKIDESKLFQVRVDESNEELTAGNPDGPRLFVHSYAYIVKDSVHPRDENTVCFLVSKKPFAFYVPAIDVAKAIHCPRCYYLMRSEGVAAEFPVGGQFPKCPACHGQTPIWIDLLGSLAPLLTSKTDPVRQPDRLPPSESGIEIKASVPLGRNGNPGLADGSEGPIDRLVDMSNKAAGDWQIQLKFNGITLPLTGVEGETEFAENSDEPQNQWLNMWFDVPSQIQDELLAVVGNGAIEEDEMNWSFDFFELRNVPEFDFHISFGDEDVSHEVEPRVEWISSKTRPIPLEDFEPREIMVTRSPKKANKVASRQKKQSKSVFCDQCGNAFGDSSRFCASCGAKRV